MIALIAIVGVVRHWGGSINSTLIIKGELVATVTYHSQKQQCPQVLVQTGVGHAAIVVEQQYISRIELPTLHMNNIYPLEKSSLYNMVLLVKMTLIRLSKRELDS